MSELTEQLRELERQRTEAHARRAQRLAAAALEVKQANREYDATALRLGRRINAIREQLEAESIPDTPTVKQAPATRKGHIDPDWSQEDQDHYRELVARGR